MAIKNRIDPRNAQARLQNWLATQWPQFEHLQVDDVHVPNESGISAETVMFAVSGSVAGVASKRELVARVQPRTGGVWESSDLRPEFEVMRALDRIGGVPVPRVLELVLDDTVLGAPFVLMERVAGRVPRDDPPFTASGWVLALRPEQQALLYDNGLRGLAAIHAVDVGRLGLDALQRDGLITADLASAIAHWRRFFAFAGKGVPNPTIETAFDWIERHRPDDPASPCLSWGDARIGNMIFADDLSVAAIIDWELLSVGSPEMDLGWWLFIMRHHTEGIGMPMPPGFPSEQDAIVRYEQLSGHAVRNFHFYYVFAALRVALAFLRGGHMMIDAGLLPAGAPMPISNPASHLLAKALDLPPPGEAVQTYIGNR